MSNEFRSQNCGSSWSKTVLNLLKYTCLKECQCSKIPLFACKNNLSVRWSSNFDGVFAVGGWIGSSLFSIPHYTVVSCHATTMEQLYQHTDGIWAVVSFDHIKCPQSFGKKVKLNAAFLFIKSYFAQVSSAPVLWWFTNSATRLCWRIQTWPNRSVNHYILTNGIWYTVESSCRHITLRHSYIHSASWLPK